MACYLSRLIGSRAPGDVSKQSRPPGPPGPLKSISIILSRLHNVRPLGVQHQLPQTLLEDLTARLKFSLHVSQRTARILGTLLLRAVVKHPLAWSIPQEVVCMLMYGILQSRQVPAWRAFFSGVGDLQTWCPVIKEKVTTGSCESWWVRLTPDKRPRNPRATINWLFLHGGAFIAGDALMYTGTFMCWMKHLARQGIDCSILTVEYPLAPEHPFPAGLNAAADAIHWLLHDSGDTADYFVGGDSAGGNLAIAALTLLRDGGTLSRLPLGITLISPAVDLSNASVFGSSEPVSSHFEQQQQQHDEHEHCRHHSHSHGHSQSEQSSASSNGVSRLGAGQRDAALEVSAGLAVSNSTNSSSAADRAEPTTAAGGQQTVKPTPGVAQLLLGGSFKRKQTQQQQPLESQGPVNVAERQLQQQQVPLQSQPSIDCKMHSAHTAGGKLRPWHLFKGVVGEVTTGWRVHSSASSAQEVARTGWFDYIPADSFADELHCYLADPKLLSHPLVSPTYLKDFTGLCQHGMLVVAGGAELMRRDIQAFAAKAAAAAAAAISQPADLAQARPGAQANAAAVGGTAGGGSSGAHLPEEAVAAAALRESEGADAGADAATADSSTSPSPPPAALALTAHTVGCSGGHRGGGSSSNRSGGRHAGGSNSSGRGGGGFRVVYHEEACEPHVYPMLTLPHLLKKGLVVPRFVAAVVNGEPLEGVAVGAAFLPTLS